MTEEEARTKWCPHVRFPDAGNRSEYYNSKCIASDCMMWKIANSGSKEGHCGLINSI